MSTWDAAPYGADDSSETVAVEVTGTVVADLDPAEAVEAVAAEAPSDAEADAELDAEIEAIDDGSEAVGPGAAHEPSGTLAFAVSAKGQLAALAAPEVTGDARVDAATARLGDLAELPTADHVAIYDDVHRRLQDALADAEVR